MHHRNRFRVRLRSPRQSRRGACQFLNRQVSVISITRKAVVFTSPDVVLDKKLGTVARVDAVVVVVKHVVEDVAMAEAERGGSVYKLSLRGASEGIDI